MLFRRQATASGLAVVLALWCLPALAQPGFVPRVESVRLSGGEVHHYRPLDVWITLVNCGDQPADTEYMLGLRVRPADGSSPGLVKHQWPMRPTTAWLPGLRFVEHVRIDGTFGHTPGAYEVALYIRDAPQATAGLVPGTALVDGLMPLTGFSYVEHHPPADPVQRALASCAARLGRSAETCPTATLAGATVTATLRLTAPVLEQVKINGDVVCTAAGVLQQEPRLRVYWPQRKAMRWATGQVRWQARPGTDRVEYTGEVMAEGVACATVSLAIVLQQDELLYQWRATRETSRCRVLFMDVPDLVRTAAADGGWLVHPMDGGQYVELATAAAGRQSLALGMLCPLSVAMLGNARGGCLVETQSLDDDLTALVRRENHRRRGCVSARLVYRAPAGEAERQFVVQDGTALRLRWWSLDGACAQAGGGQLNEWVPGGLLLQQHYPPRAPLPERLVYKILLDRGPDDPGASFADALQLIADLAQLTDNAPQLAFLVGWQYEGHDTGYPSIDRVNPDLGGLAGLQELMATAARDYTTSVSLHDNYEDHFPQSADYDPDLLLIRADGSHEPGGAVGWGESFAVAYHRYAQGAMQARVRETLFRYPVRDWYHIDVLSTRVNFRHYGRVQPASRGALVTAKFDTLAAFRRYGVEVSSESVMQPFLGRIGHFYHMVQRDVRYFSNDVSVPLVPLVVHQCCLYGCNPDTAHGRLGGAVWAGGLISCDFTPDMPRERLCDYVYLADFPALALAGRRVRGYERRDGMDRLWFAPGTAIHASPDRSRYAIFLDGRQIAGDYWTTWSPDESTVLALTARGDPLTLPLPAGHNRGELILEALTPDGPQPVPGWVRTATGVTVPAPRGHQPYRLRVMPGR